MSFYKCGHDRGNLFFKKSDLPLLYKHDKWKTTKGYDGDRSMCFNCYIKKAGDEK